ncbi:MAG: DNA mismatch repair endonuclease MutL [Candidatus Omnitrophica bacterium]|nr:DNA mismatch repair endonuclease MutL [Candidatus Omnitrophota bacterium]
MSKVHILKEDVISKIAAGEVIERPASVIKELVENAIDAGAEAIEVSLQEAGKTLIKIKDNGHGIERDDLEKIFSRHATSKIEKADDLYDIRSLGFRGEALYSIGAIADVTLRSQAKDAREGWSIHVRGGKRLDLRPCAMAGNGTEIEVKELFFNTPARRKFLKSDTTEINQILNTFIPYALFHNNIRFRLTHEGRDLVDVAPCPDAKSRAAHILHVDERHLTEARGQFPEYGLKAFLVLGDINIKRARRDMQFIFVNGRPVQNKAIGFHLNQVYRLIMPEDLYPLFVIALELPAKEIDVNIHPAKREVKIREEQKICSILRQLCEETLLGTGQTKQAGNADLRSLRHSEETIERALMGTEIFETAQGRDYAYPAAAATREKQDFFVPELNRQENLQDKLSGAIYVGAALNKYLLFQARNADLRSLLVVDQHAAAERVTYERLIRQMNKGSVEVQRLLSPVLIKLSVQEMLVWERSQEELNVLGLDSNLWDKETVAIHSYPTFLKDIEKAVRYILGGDPLRRGDHDALARRACRSSVMAGDALKPQQAEHLRDELLQCLDPLTCPHGRPTVIELSESFLDKQFLRT